MPSSRGSSRLTKQHLPLVYTRPAPPGANPPNNNSTPRQSLATVTETTTEQKTDPLPSPPAQEVREPTPPPAVNETAPEPDSPPVTLPLTSFSPTTYSPPAPGVPSKSPISFNNFGRPSTSQDSHVLHETLNVIDEHITDFNTPQLNDTLRAGGNDSESEYSSSHVDHRMSYIQGEETDEEEDGAHSRAEVMAWTADDVAEFLFTSGVEKHHCEVFRDQEISGEVLLGMDQTSLFIKAFDLGSVGRRLKTWQKIKGLQDEVNGLGTSARRATLGSDAGSSDAAGRIRSRTNTLTNSVQRLPPVDDRPVSVQTKRASVTQTPRMEPTQPVSPVSPLVDSPTKLFHEKRPSAASVRDLHHSRRHSSTDFRLTGTTLNTSATPRLVTGTTFPPQAHQTSQISPAAPQPPAAHKKQPSFDRNWTLRSATNAPRPLSSAGVPQNVLPTSELAPQDSAVDIDRGYFSGTDADSRRRNVLRKRDSDQTRHSRKSSYADEQRVRTATALSRHSRFGSVDSVRDPNAGPTSAAQKYYGLGSGVHRRTASTATTESIRPIPPAKDYPSPTVTVLDSSGLNNARSSPISPVSPMNRQGMHGDWYSRSGLKGGFGLRAISDAVTGSERSKLASTTDSTYKDSPMDSPSRTESTTPSAGLSFELDSPNDGKSPGALGAAAGNRNGARKKNKKETSAYLRGLQKTTPREAIIDADYSGWMKKKSSNLMTTWKPRLFVLKGRRLAYYYSEDDDQEKGLIDISFHRVLPADNEKLTGLHATLTGAFNTPTMPAGSNVPTLASTQASADPTVESDSIFIFKLVPPRAGLSRAVNFTKPTVHYFAVPNIKQGRLWMAALMKATIDRDDTQVITTTYQQKTISLARARQMRHRPPNLMNLDDVGEEVAGSGGHQEPDDAEAEEDGAGAGAGGRRGKDGSANGLGIVYDGSDSGVAGLVEKMGLQKVESARSRGFPHGDEKDTRLPQSA